jgi:hypothetical protein
MAGASLVLAGAACGDQHDVVEFGEVAEIAGGVSMGVSSSNARFVQNIIGLQGPESAKYDPDQDVWFISNMAGYGSGKDGNGYISRVSAAHLDSAIVFVQSGVNGATLDAPKGMAIQGDTLWVADIDKLRGFDRHTGTPVGTIDFAPMHAVLLNDVAVGGDGTMRVTDTGIQMNEAGVVHTGPDRIFSVGAGRSVSVAAQGDYLHRPNGITWDASSNRWVVVNFDPFRGEVATMTPNAGDTTRLVIRTGKGELDGVEMLKGGAILFSSWADSSVHLLSGGTDRQLVRELPVAADIGFDTKRNRVAVPLSNLNRVELWSVAVK